MSSLTHSLWQWWGECQWKIPVHNEVRYTSFPSFLTTQAVKSNWSDSQGWSRCSSRKHYARTGPWCKQEFRTLMQMGVLENIRLIAYWDRVVLIRRNIWKLTSSAEHNNAYIERWIWECDWAPQLGLGASEPAWTGRRSDVKEREQFVHWPTCRGLISPQ